jgi:hypothetical protein
MRTPTLVASRFERSECLRADAFSDEQQENTDKSRHGTNPNMMGKEEKLASPISIVEHCICQGCNVKHVDYQPLAEMLRRPGVSAH